MKKIMLAVYIILAVIAVKLIGTYALNEYFIYKYHHGDYNPQGFQSLLVVNYPEGYIAHYNYGNTLYQNNEFDGAIFEYEQALELDPPEKKECDIRINLALAMLKKNELEREKKQDVNEKDYEARIKDINDELEFLQGVKDVLTEEECAIEGEEEGHSPEAEQLLQDIEQRERELEKKKQELEEEQKQERERTEAENNGSGSQGSNDLGGGTQGEGAQGEKTQGEEAQGEETQGGGGQESGSQGGAAEGGTSDEDRDMARDVQEKLDALEEEARGYRDDYYEAITGSNRRGYHSYDGKKW